MMSSWSTSTVKFKNIASSNWCCCTRLGFKSTMSISHLPIYVYTWRKLYLCNSSWKGSNRPQVQKESSMTGGGLSWRAWTRKVCPPQKKNCWGKCHPQASQRTTPEETSTVRYRQPNDTIPRWWKAVVMTFCIKRKGISYMSSSLTEFFF